MSILDDIEHRFSYHPNTTEIVADAHEKIRTILTDAAKEALQVATDIAPAGREVSLAVTALEEADHWLHAHVARNQPPVAPEPVVDPVEPAPVVAPVAPEPVAPVVDPAPVTPVEPVAPDVEPAPAPVPEATVALDPVSNKPLYTHSGVNPVDTAWAVAADVTDNGVPLYVFAGDTPGVAVATGASADWVPFTGTPTVVGNEGAPPEAGATVTPAA